MLSLWKLTLPSSFMLQFSMKKDFKNNKSVPTDLTSQRGKQLMMIILKLGSILRNNYIITTAAVAVNIITSCMPDVRLSIVRALSH